MELNQGSPSYYSILGVRTDSSDEQIRRAYRKLAMRWHPDKWTRNPASLGEVNRKFQQIQEAYSVLSDKRKRIMYDAGLYDSHDEDDEGFADFLQEMMSLMDNARREEKSYSLGEIQSMFWEMVQSFDLPNWSDSPQTTINEPPQLSSHGTFTLDDSRTSKRARSDTKPVAEEDLHFRLSGFGWYETRCL